MNLAREVFCLNKRFCPKCGSTSKPLVKGFCLNCFLADHPGLVVAPKEMEVEQCKHCSKIRLKGKFVELSEENLKQIVLVQVKVKELSQEKISVQLSELVEGEIKALVSVQGLIDDSLVSLKKIIALKLKTVLCDSCMRLTSQYHEGILQVRGEKKTSKEKFQEVLLKVNALLAEQERKDALARVVELHWTKNGFDVWIGSRRATKIVAEALGKEFHFKPVVSVKLVGIKQGRKKYRFTYLVRLKQD